MRSRLLGDRELPCLRTELQSLQCTLERTIERGFDHNEIPNTGRMVKGLAQRHDQKVYRRIWMDLNLLEHIPGYIYICPTRIDGVRTKHLRRVTFAILAIRSSALGRLLFFVRQCRTYSTVRTTTRYVPA